MKSINSLSELVKEVCAIGKTTSAKLMFRGEKKYYADTALQPKVYRDSNYIKHEDVIFRESQRFNDNAFIQDMTVFDRLSRMQHYTAPTRLLDLSEDLLSAVYFAIAEKGVKDNEDDAVVYVFELDASKAKYYDSDTVAVLSNLAKLPLRNDVIEKKSKAYILDIALKRDKKIFNEKASYLLHQIRDEKPQFAEVIEPKHITSIQLVYPKISNDRLRSQKGAFLLFGLNATDASKSIPILDEDKKLIESDNKHTHPIGKIHIFSLDFKHLESMKQELITLGISMPYVYPEIDKVSEDLCRKYKTDK